MQTPRPNEGTSANGGRRVCLAFVAQRPAAAEFAFRQAHGNERPYAFSRTRPKGASTEASRRRPYQRYNRLAKPYSGVS